MDEVLPDIKIGSWVIKGYIYEGALILKAQNGSSEIVKKFSY